MYEIHVQRPGRKISAAGQLSYIDIIVIALLEMSVVGKAVACVRVSAGDARSLGRGVSERNEVRLRAVGKGSEASLCKVDGQFGNPGIPMARGCRVPDIFCGIVSARLSAGNGRWPEPVAHQSLMDVRLY